MCIRDRSWRRLEASRKSGEPSADWVLGAVLGRPGAFWELPRRPGGAVPGASSAILELSGPV
eukprot:5308984-Pyramimonas_sp.AAC.1